MEEKIKIIPIANGEAHLQNEIISKECYVCKVKQSDLNEQVLLRIDKNKMGFACTHHSGVVAEFIKQFKHEPLDWKVS